MDNRTTIKNSFLTVEISNTGAELKSIVDKDGTQRLWQGGEEWKGQAPLLFPVCGCMAESRYLYNGTSYTISPHGFARKSVFALECSSDDKAVYLLTSNEDTHKVYPFDFELRVTYTLNENTLAVTYTVNNTTDGDMYFSIGSHEGYLCEGETTDYNLFFDKKEVLPNYLLNGPLLNGEVEDAPITAGVMELCDSEFARLDTYIFRDTESKSVTLKKKGAEKSITVDFSETPNLLIWKEPGAPFMCIEPWCGVPDHDGEVRELSDKDGIVKLEKNGVFTNTHTIIID